VRGRFKWLTLAVVSAFVLLTAAAQAAPPTLVSVAGTGGRVTASWTLPPGMAMDFIEAGTTSVTNPQGGDFPLKDTVLAESLDDFATSYVASVQIPPGSYFVHVSAFDTTKCVTGNEPDCVDEWSNIVPVTIPSGVADRSTDFSFLDATSPQKIGKLFVEAQMAEPGTITATGTVQAPKASKVYRFKTATAKVLPGNKVKLRLRLPKKALKVVKKALRRGKKLKAKVTVTAKDNAGNTHSAKGTIKLKL
jgi:hypothetical protein